MEPTAPPQPAPELAQSPTRETKPADNQVPIVIAKGGDPEDGGEIARSGGVSHGSGVGAGGATGGQGLGGLGGGGGSGPGEGGGTGIGGTGSGVGRGRAQPAPTRSVAIGQVKMSGDGTLDGAIVRRYLKRNQPKFQYCYERELQSNPSIAGATQIMFTIAADGSVTGAHAGSTINANVEQCVLMVVTRIEFPKPKGGSVDATVPLRFTTQ
jgi:outer membrane biosynthesis protein TonB